MHEPSTSNYFVLFEVPLRFEIDMDILKQRYHHAQKIAHPDRFVNDSPQQRQWATRYASLINDAYRILKSPVLRAHHLLSISGNPPDDEQTIDDSELLMQQLQWQEKMARLKKTNDGDQSLHNEIRQAQQKAEQKFSQAWQETDTATAQQQYHKLRFIDKIAQQLHQINGV